MRTDSDPVSMISVMAACRFEQIVVVAARPLVSVGLGKISSPEIY